MVSNLEISSYVYFASLFSRRRRTSALQSRSMRTPTTILVKLFWYNYYLEKKIDKICFLFIVGFIPNATMETAHHMLLYGCEEPGSDEEVWYSIIQFFGYIAHSILTWENIYNSGIVERWPSKIRP